MSVADRIERLAADGPLYDWELGELAEAAGCTVDAVRELVAAYRAAMRGPADKVRDAFRPVAQDVLIRWSRARSAVGG